MKKDLGIKIFFIVLLFISLYLIITGITATDTPTNNNPNEILEEELQVSPTSLDILVGDEETITASIIPPDATYKNLTWASSNPHIAMVEDGKVTGISAGNCVITVVTEKRQIKKIINVKVSNKEVPIEKIVVSNPKIEMYVGDKTKLEYTIEPENATNKSINISTEDKTIVAFDQEKNIVGVAKGTTNIVLKSSNGIEAKVAVTVKEKEIPVTGVTLSKSSLSLKVGASATITAKVKPSNATHKEVTWSSSDTKVATVKDGKITAVKEGTATITVKTTEGGKTATCKVTVSPKQASPIVPSSATYKYEGSTFKYYVVNKQSYYLTYIWMEDPANQIKKLEANTAKYGKVLKDSEITGGLNRAPVGEMMNSYISKGLIPTSKAAIGYNASGFYVAGAWNPPSDYYNNRSSSWLVITDGIITRSRTDDNTNTNSLMVAITGDGNMKVYDGGISKADREKTVSQMKADNVRNTWSFAPLLISNGQRKPWGSKETAKRQGICQVNSNNYIMLTATGSMKIDDVGDIFATLGCQTAFNLDGGGSTSLFIKNPGASTATKIVCSDGSTHTACRSIVEGIYFVEK